MRLFFTTLLLLSLSCTAIMAQTSQLAPRYELGFDLLPLIVTGSTNSSHQLGMEVFFTKQINSGKIRVRYLINERGNYANNTVLSRSDSPLPDNRQKQVENRYLQLRNHGLRLGFEQIFRTSRVDYYWSFDLYGQLNRGQIYTETTISLVDRPEIDPFLESRIVSHYNNYEFGFVPSLGLGFNLDERIRIRVEMGPKLSLLFERIPLRDIDNNPYYREGVFSSSELFLINDILISYNF
ncbi:MAG: hypothetical protein AAFP77_08745 [Bacteroidota bacterium]